MIEIVENKDKEWNDFLIILAITACCNGIRFSSVIIALIIHVLLNKIIGALLE